jgi:hypothetical protein
MAPYVEPGGTWRAFWLVAGALAVLLVLDLALPGGDVPALSWLLTVIVVLGIIGIGCLSARRVWTVRVDGMARTQPSPSAARPSPSATSTSSTCVPWIRESTPAPRCWAVAGRCRAGGPACR